MSKKKKAQGFDVSELNVIVPSQLEDVRDAIATLANPKTEVSFSEEIDGKIAFRLRHLQWNGSPVAINGRLMRWQGTDTRVDCDTEMYQMISVTAIFGNLIMFSLSLLSTVATLLIFTAYLRYYSVVVLINLIIFAGLTVTFWSATFGRMGANFYDRRLKRLQVLDGMMQRLADVLVQVSNTPLTLLDDDFLTEHGRNDVWLGADGELVFRKKS